MTDTKNYFEILGVKQDASREEIEKRYDILLKRYRSKKLSGEAGEEDEKNWADITEAYRQLTEYQSMSAIEPEPISPTHVKVNELIRKFGMDDKKVNNFLHYHKYHIVISIVLLIVVVFTIKGFVTRVDPDLNVSFLGRFYVEDTDVMNQKIQENLPDIKAASTDVITITDQPADAQLDYTMRTKAMAIMAAGDVDVFILDKDQFEIYGEQGVFENLDSLASELGTDKDKVYMLKNSETNEEHVYGIDVSGSSFLKSINITGAEDKVVALKVEAKHREKAVEFLKLLLKK